GRLELERSLERIACRRVLAQLHVHERLHVVRRHEARVVLDRGAGLIERHRKTAALVVLRREAGVHLGAAARIHHARVGDAARFGRSRAHAAGKDEGECGKEARESHGWLEWMRTVRFFMRFTTWPASCPQAASMSSPRVLRTVAMKPASSRICWKRRTRVAS